MRPPRESEKLYTELKAMIAARKFYPGVQLPPEPELARKFKAARNTLRRAMSVLKAEGVVERRPGKGTFVVSDGEAPRINFLVPDAGYVDDWVRCGSLGRELLSGAKLAASTFGCRLVPLPVPQTESGVVTDYGALKDFGPDDMVLLPSVWFTSVFEFLHGRGCRAAFVHRQTFHVKRYASCMTGWNILEMDRIGGMEKAVRGLYEAGCRKVALVHPYLDEESPPVVEGYRRAIAGRQEECFVNQRPGDLSGLAEFCRKTRFDGLVISGVCFPLWAAGNIGDVLGIPPGVKVLVWEADDMLRLDGIWGKAAFSTIQMGYDAVRMLVFGHASAKKYEPVFFR